MTVRTLDLADAEAFHALVVRPDVARRLGRTPWDPMDLTRQALAEPSGGRVHRLGLWSGTRLTAAVGLEVGPAARTSHEGRMWLASEGSDLPEAPVRRMLEAADRWLGLLRLEVELPAGDPLVEALEAQGFEVEVRKRCHRAAEEGLDDTVVLARLRPGWTPAPPTAPPAPAPRGAPVAPDLRLRAPRVEDAAAYARISRHPSITWGTLQTPTGGEALWRARLEGNDPRNFRGLVAELEDEVVGVAGLHLLPPPFAGGAPIGMSVAADWQGRGVGRVLLQALVELGEAWLGLSRIELEVYPDNVPARRLYESHGFEAEGLRRKAVLRDGAYVDVLVMARTRTGARAHTHTRTDTRTRARPRG